MEYQQIKKNTFQLLKSNFPAMDIIFRNVNCGRCLLILTPKLTEHAKAVKMLASSGLFKTRQFTDREWEFNLIVDSSIYHIFKKDKDENRNNRQT